MELVLPMYKVHPYLSFKNSGKRVHIIHGKIQYIYEINNLVVLGVFRRS